MPQTRDPVTGRYGPTETETAHDSFLTAQAVLGRPTKHAALYDVISPRPPTPPEPDAPPHPWPALAQLASRSDAQPQG